jgi:hypothetical protein
LQAYVATFGHDDARATTDRGLRFLQEHGMSSTSRLPTLASAAAGGDPTVAPSFAALDGTIA